MCCRGQDFRSQYRDVDQLQSIVDAPTLCLTATVTPDIQKDIMEVLCLQEESIYVIATLPERENIFVHVTKTTEKFNDELLFITDHIKENGASAKKILIFTTSVHVCQQIYFWMMSLLDEDGYSGAVEIATRIVEMYHANIDEDTRNRIVETFVKVDSHIRVVVATIAFGMGIQIEDVDLVVHWGAPSTVLQYWQEAGRCGRDGRSSISWCMAYARSLTKADAKMKQLVNEQQCLRSSVLATFLLPGMDSTEMDAVKARHSTSCGQECVDVCNCAMCQCCTTCYANCTCSKKVNDKIAFHLQSGK